MKQIRPDNLLDYAFVNEDTLVRPLRGICVCFHGYTDATMYEKSDAFARTLGEKGVAWVFPYYSVWAWMSRNSQEFNEQVLDAVYERLGADESVPLIVSGGSMGGLTALNYLIYGKRKAIGCALNCPVTDMNKIFADQRDFRRAILSAHIEKDASLEEIMKTYSPVCFAESLPHIPYFFVFGQADTYFFNTQMPPMIEKLRQYKIKHTLLTVPGMKHCDLSHHPEAQDAFGDFIVSLVAHGSPVS